MGALAIIPARWASSRFPGKPLAPIAGRPMIALVIERALAIPGIAGAVVATDSPDIARAAAALGARHVMTSPDHQSGSDRLAEAADLLGLADSALVLNVQGDQPLLDPLQAGRVLAAMEAEPDLEAATLAVPLDPAELANPNHVKVVVDLEGYALYFSRAPIPFSRDGGPADRLKHVGLYAYRAGFLRRFVTWPRGVLEAAESLEQLRILERGRRIKVVVGSGASPEVDAPADVARVEAALAAAKAAGESI
jgi:3-deoxy-manno-octulosonate cytidylyltransferase (CMP-KDO synthetase)